MIGPILRRARKGNSRRIIMEARLPHFSHSPRPAPFSAPPRNTNQKPARFSSVRVGAYCIRPIDGHTGGRTNRKIAIFQVARVGAYCICPTSGHVRGRMNPIPTQKSIPRTKRGHILTRFSIPRIKMNFKTPIFSFIRPLSWSFLGRMQYAPTRVPEKMAIFFCTG